MFFDPNITVWPLLSCTTYNPWLIFLSAMLFIAAAFWLFVWFVNRKS